jgi:hypothetical protein
VGSKSGRLRLVTSQPAASFLVASRTPPRSVASVGGLAGRRWPVPAFARPRTLRAPLRRFVLEWPLRIKCPCCPRRVEVAGLLDYGCCSPRGRVKWRRKLRRTGMQFTRCKLCGCQVLRTAGRAFQSFCSPRSERARARKWHDQKRAEVRAKRDYWCRMKWGAGKIARARARVRLKYGAGWPASDEVTQVWRSYRSTVHCLNQLHLRPRPATPLA